jgi:glycogen phosphorylase
MNTQDFLSSMRNRHFNIIYITPEILYHPKIQTGSGGLGVVAGSFMKQVEDGYKIHGLTALAISTFPTYGYQQQYVIREVVNGIPTTTMTTGYEKFRDTHLVGDTGVRIPLELANQPCHTTVRVAQEKERKHTALLFLDSDTPENTFAYRMITSVLYGEGNATAFFDDDGQPWRNIAWLRILQAAVLGVGSYQLIKKLGITYDKIHLNESHPVFFLINQLGEYMRDGADFTTALLRVQKKAVFTNHTLLESGNKWYSVADVHAIGKAYPGFSHDTLRDLCGNQYPNLSMTDTALKLVGRGNVNGVSVHHAEIADKLWPGYDIFPVTNGISDEYVHPACNSIVRPNEIPELKKHLKLQALQKLKENAGDAGYQISVGEDEMLRAIFVVWARRCQLYKRPGILWHRKELGLAKALLEWGHIAIAWGGYVHPDDTVMMHDWNRYWQRFKNFPNTIPIFNYRMEFMMLLKAGAQIWLNTPVFGNEACGTSWMSAIRNYALNLSIPDGGIREANHYIAFGSEDDTNWHTSYKNDARGMWQNIVKYSLKLRELDEATYNLLFDACEEAKEKFSAERMVSDYIQKLYRF